jgi:photosystem II stability/assembly factor-like uncharacterized protein
MKRSLLVLVVLALLLLLMTVAPAAGAFNPVGWGGGWFWQNPMPQGNSLAGVSFGDASHCWAVGVRGTILASSDAGLTWTPQLSPTTEDLADVCFVDGQHGWAVGSRRTIIFTSDGGVTWTKQTSDTTGRLNAVSFADASHGWVVGEGGVILATADGGMTWNPQTSGTTGELYDVSFADASHGWATGDLSLLVTNDGGATWDLRSTPQLLRVSFVSATQGWAGGDGIRMTTDGGTTWADQYAPGPDVSVFVNAISFRDSLHGLALERNFTLGVSRIAVTSDGGAHWDFITVDAADQNGICAGDAAHACAVGEVGSITVTTDGGATWSDDPSFTRAPVQGVAFASPTTGWVVGSDGIFKTTDGGASWTPQSSGTTALLEEVVFTDGQHGVTSGLLGTILTTDDGGSTWTPRASGTDEELMSLSFADALHGWAIGIHGAVVATTDGGGSWQQVGTVGMGGIIQDACFVDALRGWAVESMPGTIMATSDGGKTWRRQGVLELGESWPMAVTFTDATHGWVVCLGNSGYGTGGRILMTSDGGKSWKAVAAGAPFSGIGFADPLHGYAAGPYGSVYATADGGVTWHAQNVPYRFYSRDLFVFDPARAWVVGDDAGVVATTTGGLDAAPTTLASGDDDRWSKSDVVLAFTATPSPTGSAVSYTEYSTDAGATWVRGSSCPIAAPSSHAADGLHPVLFRSADTNGHVEAVQQRYVHIDTRKPATKAPRSATVRRGRAVTLYYAVRDTTPCWPLAAVTVKVKNPRGKVVKTLRVAAARVGSNLPLKFTVPKAWKPGTYKFYVYARDKAGNTQANVASNKLVVK